MSINANIQHLLSHSYLTILNWIMPVCTSQSLPPLRPCLTSHFRQGWGCECTFRLAPPDFGFDNFRIKSTNPVSQAVVYFAISFITSSTRAAIHQTSLPIPKCQRQPPRQSALPHESLAHPLPCCPHAYLTQTCPVFGILPDTPLVLPFIPLSRAQTSARNTSTEPYLVRSTVHKRDPS